MKRLMNFDENGDWKINWKLENGMYVYVHLKKLKGLYILKKKRLSKKNCTMCLMKTTILCKKKVNNEIY